MQTLQAAMRVEEATCAPGFKDPCVVRASMTQPKLLQYTSCPA